MSGLDIFFLFFVVLGGGLFLFFIEKIDSCDSERNFIDFSGLPNKLNDLESDLKNCQTGLDVWNLRERCWEIRKEYGAYLDWISADRIHDVVMKCSEILHNRSNINFDEEEQIKIKREEKNERIKNR